MENSSIQLLYSVGQGDPVRSTYHYFPRSPEHTCRRPARPVAPPSAQSARQPGSTAGVTLHRCTSSAAAAGSSAVPSSMVCQAGSGCLRCQSSYSLTSSPQTPTSSQGPQTIACRRSGWRPPDNPCLSELASATDWPDPSRFDAMETVERLGDTPWADMYPLRPRCVG